MQEALAEIKDRNFETVEEISDFLNSKLNTPAPKKAPRTNKDRAQQLVYEAMKFKVQNGLNLLKKP